MPLYNVHLYREMKLYFPKIDADSPETAAEFARQQPTHNAQSIDECDGNDTAALVDVVGDDEFIQSRIVDFPAEPDLAAILQYAVDTEEGNWDDGTGKPEWLTEARRALDIIHGRKKSSSDNEAAK
jgi:hypothetical protein